MRQFLILCILPFFVWSAEDTDSLKAALESASGKSRYEILYDLTKKLYKDDPDLAMEYAREASRIAEDYNDRSGQGDCFNYIGKIHSRRSNFDSAGIYFRKALDIRKNLDDKEKIIRSYGKIGNNYFRLGKYGDALEAYDKGLSICHKFGYRELTAVFLSSISLMNYRQGDFDIAIENCHRALKISEELGDKSTTGQIFQRIGGVYFYGTENYPKALEYYTKALDNSKEMGDSNSIAGNLNNVGMVYQRQNKLDTALKYFYDAMEINKRSGNKIWQSKNLNNIGQNYKYREEYSEALKYYHQSLDLRKPVGNKKDIAWVKANIADTYSLMGDYKKAIEYYLECLDLLKGIDVKAQLLEYYGELATLYSLINDHKRAYEYSQLFNSLRDSVYNEEKVKTITEIQTKYETEKKEKENEILKRDAKIRKNFQILLLVIVSALLALSVLLFLLFRMKNKSLRKNRQLFEQERKLKELELKNKETERARLEEIVFAEQQINKLQQEKIEHKSRELSSVTLHILSKNQALENIRNEVLAMKESDQEASAGCSRILGLIEGDHILDQDWDQFKKHFEEVHPGFFKKLNGTFNGLTANDIKLCAYLKINLSTKEMARMLNVTIAAINKSRQRLRKKLGLEPEANLIDFINSI